AAAAVLAGPAQPAGGHELGARRGRAGARSRSRRGTVQGEVQHGRPSGRGDGAPATEHLAGQHALRSRPVRGRPARPEGARGRTTTWSPVTVRRPAVLVVTEQPWHSLLQLSAALRRRGVAVVLVGRVRGRDERVMARLLFAEVCEPTALGALAERYDVVDVQGRDEDVVELMTLYGKRLGEPVRSLVARSAHQADKVRMAEVLGRGDVPVPRHLVAPVHSTTVVRDIGLPVVVKTRVGAGGQGVTR